MSRPKDTIRRRFLHSEVAERLRDLIVTGELAPGERLNERLLTQRFNISRTPVRDAIKMLSADGLVKLLPNRSAVVTSITREEAQDLFQLIGALEALSGELACQRATDEDIARITSLHNEMREQYASRNLEEYFRLNQRIHQDIVECARNAELSECYRRLAGRIRGARYVVNFAAERWHAAMQEHEEILAALTQRDSEGLKALLAKHLKNKFDVIHAWLSQRESRPAAPKNEEDRGSSRPNGGSDEPL